MCSPVVTTIIGLCEVGLGLLLLIIGYAAPYWANYDVSGVNVNFGLWESCSNGDNCGSLSSELETSKMKAARAFGVLGMIAAVGSIVPAILYLVKKRGIFLVVAAIMAAVTFVMVLIEFSVAVAQVREVTTDYNFCFNLTLSAFLDAFFGSITFTFTYFADKKKVRQQEKNKIEPMKE